MDGQELDEDVTSESYYVVEPLFCREQNALIESHQARSDCHIQFTYSIRDRFRSRSHAWIVLNSHDAKLQASK